MRKGNRVRSSHGFGIVRSETLTKKLIEHFCASPRRASDLIGAMDAIFRVAEIQPSTISTFVSSGCIRLTNEDVEDLYSRVSVGTRVIVLPGANTAASQLLPRR